MKGIHVDQDVPDINMNEYRRDEAPNFPSGNGLVDFRANLADYVSLSAHNAIAVDIRTKPLKNENDDRKADGAIRNRKTRQNRAEIDGSAPPGCFRCRMAETVVHSCTRRGITRWCSASMIARIVSTASSNSPSALTTT